MGLEGKDLEAFVANYDNLIDVLTNKDNDAFDLARSKSLLGDYYTDLRKQEYEKGFKYHRGQKALKAGEAWEGSYKALPILNSKEYTDYDTGILMLESMRASEKGQKTYFGLKGDFFNYNPDTKKWTTGIDNTKWNWEGGATTTQLIVKLGLSTSEFQAMKGELPPPGTKKKKEKEKEKTKVPYPKRSITSSNFDTTGNSQYQVLSDLEETYKDYPGFKFENSLGTLLVTAPDGTKKYISMNRTLGGNKESRDEIQAFIAKHAKTK